MPEEELLSDFSSPSSSVDLPFTLSLFLALVLLVIAVAAAGSIASASIAMVRLASKELNRCQHGSFVFRICLCQRAV